MKSIKSTAILILGSLFVAISFAACSAEDNIPEKAPQVPCDRKRLFKSRAEQR